MLSPPPPEWESGETLDVAIIGGSFAGCAAALQLGRARRSVAVIDAGQPRNRRVEHSHGFLTQDAQPPALILNTARQQLLRYPTVRLISGHVETVRNEEGAFLLGTKEGPLLRARRLILAIGVHDELPPVEGMSELWARSVFHCPYCHGFEVRDHPLAVLGSGAIGVHQAVLLKEWSDDVLLFTNGGELSDEERARLERRGVPIETRPVARLLAEGDQLTAIELADGERIPRHALLTATRVSPSGDLPTTLGCQTEDHLGGTMITVGAMRETSVPGVFAAGDAARFPHSVSFAVADGVLAGISAHHSLLKEDWD